MNMYTSCFGFRPDGQPLSKKAQKKMEKEKEKEKKKAEREAKQVGKILQYDFSELNFKEAFYYQNLTLK